MHSLSLARGGATKTHFYSSFSNIMVLGDLNLDMKQGAPSNVLHTIMGNYDLSNLITEPTCFKSDHPTLIDVVLVNRPRRFIKTSLNFDPGLSDFHNLICY